MVSVQEAVADPTWQRFRLSMKGQPTKTKLSRLQSYYIGHLQAISASDAGREHHLARRENDCAVCLQIDNYIKALCRGGQLYPGESLDTAVLRRWKLRIKR